MFSRSGVYKRLYPLSVTAPHLNVEISNASIATERENRQDNHRLIIIPTLIAPVCVTDRQRRYSGKSDALTCCLEGVGRDALMRQL
jgi:hypothetical protein